MKHEENRTIDLFLCILTGSSGVLCHFFHQHFVLKKIRERFGEVGITEVIHFIILLLTQLTRGKTIFFKE